MNKRYLFLAAVLLFTLMYVSAAPLNPNPISDPDPVPLDGGLLALLAAGAAYGIKKIPRSSDD